MAHEVSASRTTESLPEQRTGGHDLVADAGQTAEPSASVRPVPLERLLSVAVLTPAQASLVAVQLLDAAVHGARVGAVTVTPTGVVEVGTSRADETTAVSGLLEELVRNARRLPAHPKPEQLLLLRRLEEAAGDAAHGPGARACELETALTDTLGTDARQRLSGQLAALVHAFAHVAPTFPTQGVPTLPVAGPPPETAHRAAPTRHVPGRPPRRRTRLRRGRRGRRVALVVLVLVAVLAGAGYLLVRDQGIGVIGSFGAGSQPAEPATPAPAHPAKHPATQPPPHHSPAVPRLAARHAGPVTGVAVHRTRRCEPGALCPVKVTVHLRPASTGRTVGWKVGAARLCKRGITWSPATTVTARPGWTKVYASSSVRVPAGRSLALTAVTTAPARAQSRPVPVTGSSLHC